MVTKKGVMFLVPIFVAYGLLFSFVLDAAADTAAQNDDKVIARFMRFQKTRDHKPGIVFLVENDHTDQEVTLLANFKAQCAQFTAHFAFHTPIGPGHAREIVLPSVCGMSNGKMRIESFEAQTQPAQRNGHKAISPHKF